MYLYEKIYLMTMVSTNDEQVHYPTGAGLTLLLFWSFKIWIFLIDIYHS